MLAHTVRKLVPERYRPIGYLTSLTRTRTGCRVRSGPFAGMRYGPVAVGSAYIPKLLGIYDRELAGVIEDVCSGYPARIVDIGAAEGYYAVGLAIRNPAAEIIAFEADREGRSLLHRTAALNDVTAQLDIRGRCEPADLESALTTVGAPVVVCDVEGYEKHLLDPACVPSLVRSKILVELHDFISLGVTDLLHHRFEPTHRIRYIHQEARSRAEFPWRTFGTAILPNSYLDWAVSEWRPERMSWQWMEPLSGARGHHIRT